MARSMSPVGVPSVQKLQRDVQKMARIRDAGRERLRQLEEVRPMLRC